MSEDGEDDASKTEEPSQKKLDEARKKGQYVQSRELNHFFLLLALTIVIMMLAPAIGRDITNLLSPFLQRPDSFEMDASNTGEVLREVLGKSLIIMLLPIAVAFAAVFAPSAVMQRFAFTTEQIKPKLEKISIIKGFSRIYSKKSLIEFIKNTAKISVVGILTWYCAKPYFGYVDALSEQSSMEILNLTQAIAGKIMIGVCIFLFLLSIGDYLLQRFMFMKSMRMTKQEVKEEYKQQEGDPHIKSKLKQIRREKSRKRMMSNVPKADVIVTNPTHFAVALQYNPETMAAPKVVAKGADAVAAKIRSIAQENRIPIIRNPPLAKVLYDTTDIDQIIPSEHFQAVAKIIGYAYRLKGKAPKAAEAVKKKATKLGLNKPPTQ